ncbi:MAG: ATP-dependent zinc metalloprotease FtsH, partial [Chloroflexi bacterium]|nr:ATP-dependent zinc metalloprotease FtsH [Chloroflexota bacterium]
EGRVERIEVRGDDLTVITTDQLTHKARKESGSSLLEILQRAGVETGPKGVDVEVKGGSGWGGVFNILISFLPLIFFGALLLFMMRQAQGAGSQSLNFARSRARLFMANRSTVTFGDVAGVEEAKTELQEVVEFLKFPERFAALGARVPRGLLLMGPPGTGKTLLAKAVAGEAGVPFFSISGSEFVEMFVGVGASRVRDLFDQAKRNAPCIVFIDEIDAVGRHRGAGLGGGHDEREQTLNQILVEMDGFDTGTNIIVIAATNRPDILDPALLRPGRFDRRVVLDLPDINGRKAILMVHGRGKPLEDSVGYDDIARQTPGFSGADLANLVNEAAILAARRGKKTIGWLEFAEAIDRIIAGPERKSRVISPKEKEVTAYHEAGHALVAQMLPNADPVQKISIVSRGVMGGYTRMLPQEDRYLWTKTQFKDRLAVAMGGRTAEELIFNEVTTGASNDLEQATSISRQMVTRFGMSEKLGPRTFGRREEMVFLGREIVEQRDYSDSIAQEIDEEVKHLIEEAHAVATQTLVAQKRKLIELARYLILHETIEGEELKKIFASEPPSLEELQKPLPAPIPATVAAKPPPMPSEEQTPELSPSPRKKEPGPAAAPAT